MHPILQFLLSIVLFMVIHVSAMALCARALGITIRRIGYGVGPALFNIGKAQIRLLPFAGSLVLKDTREEAIHDDDPGNDTYNERPLWQQIAVLLCGVAVPLALALGLLGANGWHGFTAAFAQMISGALAPLSTAQQLLADGEAFARDNAFVLVFALASLKLCAFNLLPFGGLNGGQILLAIARAGKPHVAWEETVAKWLLLPGLAVLLSWLLASGWYCWRHFTG
ncbi:site-2 protease family protein [Janthinobacterium sp. PC23-8]|uniref:site-2 protease family protein n=1 Tax=Janthinobacterium sp. PC23-8 TaxID=2012679 RepID=UPI000B965B24|nr:site-2 protease family protein [Janthinobacterium sp. PC23-8]OYO30243.1 hypothetical protein CD932_03175 [Janthinobacterium sp. PC23-8]